MKVLIFPMINWDSQFPIQIHFHINLKYFVCDYFILVYYYPKLVLISMNLLLLISGKILFQQKIHFQYFQVNLNYFMFLIFQSSYPILMASLKSSTLRYFIQFENSLMMQFVFSCLFIN